MPERQVYKQTDIDAAAAKKVKAAAALKKTKAAERKAAQEGN